MTEKKLGIDIHSLAGTRTGVANYVFHLTRALSQTAPTAPIELYGSAPLPNDLRTSFQFHLVRGKRYWTTAHLSRYWLTHARPAAMLYPAHILPLYSPARNLVTIHDLAFELFPTHFTAAQLRRLRNGTRRSVKKADHLLAVSEATKADLVNIYGVSPERITVTPLGCDTSVYRPVSASEKKRVIEKYKLTRPYIISVGTLQKRKNHIALVKALRQLLDDGNDLDLVLAGGKGWLFEETEKTIQELRLTGHVKLLGFVPDEDLPALYGAAEVFALTSLYEGFGLPLVEAMACGTAVVTANNSALKEVAGDAALTVDAEDVPATATALGKVITDKALRAKLVSQGLARAKEFSWERTAKLTLEAMQKVVRR